MKTKIIGRLPSVELQHNMDFFKRGVEDLERLEELLTKQLEAVLPAEDLTLEEQIKFARMRCELNEVESKIRIQAHNYEIYETRVEQYGPIFERETKETEESWESLWEGATMIARKFQTSGVANILNGYPKEQYNPETFSQELKNETAKALRAQIKSYHKQLEDGKKNKGRK